MIWASSEVVTVLTFLLPGLVASGIFYLLTAYPRPNEFNQIVQALIFTSVVQTIVRAIILFGYWLGAEPLWMGDWEVVFALLIAVAFALIWSWLTNYDTLHRFLRWIKVTKETSYPSEWYPAFARNSKCYVVLHLKGKRRLYGWPDEWPSRPGQGHFRILEPEWLTEEENRPSTGVEEILISVDQVEMVEFLEMESSERTK